MEEPSDNELWERASESDAAFGTLFERHASSVYNYCFRSTGDSVLVAEAAAYMGRIALLAA
ncbi:MAG: hypothetical protein ABR575_02100 [Actinomycetota bacterium]